MDRVGVRDGLLLAAGAVVVAALVWFSLGMNRGLLLASDVKTRVWPWAAVLPPGEPQNPILTDPVWQFVPWLELARRELLDGRLPLWNPYQDGGVPLLANPMTALGSPLVWPVLALGVEHGWNVSLLLRMVLLWAAMAAMLRGSGASRAAAALGGTVPVLSGPFVAWLANPNTMVVAPLPLLLLAVRRLARGETVGLWFPVTAMLTYLVLAGGHPETALFAGAVVAALALVHVRGVRRLALLAGAALVGMALWGPFLAPFAEYLWQSEARSGVGREAFVLPVAGLLRLVAPGAPIGNPVTGAAGVSVTGLALATIGVWAGRGRRETWVWAGVAAAVLLVCFDNPIARWLALGTPLHWTRSLILLPIPVGALAAAGLDRVRLGALRRGWPRLAGFAAPLAIAVAAGELLPAAARVHPVTDPRWLDRSTPVLEALKRDAGPFRVLPLHTFLPPNAATTYGLEDVRGYDAIAPAGWRHSRAAIGRFSGTATVSDVLEPWDLTPGGTALDRWNVKYLVLPPQLPYPSWRLNRELGLDLEEAYSGPDGRLLRNRRALPRLRLDVPGHVELEWRTATTWRITVEAETPGTLLVANPCFPGWRVRVDGRAGTSDCVPGEPFRVPVQAGNHRVELRYAPSSFALGLGLALAGIASLVVVARRRPAG